ncbi:hypothetical protein EVAR_53265_1 [Eumeta japonica]|uniref:Uncharacterized protein n=1 Tax=Eumeta variegata TaxID=151549 RepID=A0A4C1YJK5_EUMVA|nr:hypothetical protein EVAR_53265_1 [Eumeta japonica]
MNARRSGRRERLLFGWFSISISRYYANCKEATWFLLGLPTRETSWQVFFIPTQHPSKQFEGKKSRQQMDNEGVDDASADVWKGNIIGRLKKRPSDLDHVTWAKFVDNLKESRKKKKKTKNYSMKLTKKKTLMARIRLRS